MTLNNIELNRPSDIIDGFASSFKSVYASNNSNNSNISDTNNININESICLDSISIAEIELQIKQLNNKPTIGPDQVPNCIVKGCSVSFASALYHIFNLSLQTGIYPKIWKVVLYRFINLKTKLTLKIIAQYEYYPTLANCLNHYIHFTLPKN